MKGINNFITTFTSFLFGMLLVKIIVLKVKISIKNLVPLGMYMVEVIFRTTGNVRFVCWEIKLDLYKLVWDLFLNFREYYIL